MYELLLSYIGIDVFKPRFDHVYIISFCRRQPTMNWVTRVLVSQLVVMLDWVAATADSMDAAQCLERGFNSAKLLCSSCEDLKQFDLGKVASDCSACCVSDGGSAALENTKYERAILEVRNLVNCKYLFFNSTQPTNALTFTLYMCTLSCCCSFPFYENTIVNS